MQNPFEKKVSASNLALTFETKTAVMPEQPACLRSKIEALGKEANELEAKLENELAQIWSFFEKEKDAYYQKRVLSYSFLKHVDSVRNPKPQFGNKERNFALGRAFEDMLTDCLDVSKFPDLETSDFENLQKMCEYAKKDAWVNDFLLNFQTQVECTGEIKGFKFKGKLDFYNVNEPTRVGADLKTTSAKTLAQFKKACLDFGYYTQAYIYSELKQLGCYIISGVCKKAPLVFTVGVESGELAEGERELDRLLENLTYYGIADYFKAK